MTDSEKLDYIISFMQDMKEDVQELKGDMQVLKEEVKELKEDVQVLKEEVKELREDVQILKDEVQQLKEDMKVLKEEVQQLKKDVQVLKEEVQQLKERVDKIELTLEKEVRDNIRIIAEGHLDLSRDLHEAMKPGNEIEILSIKVGMLETDVRELKAKIS